MLYIKGATELIPPGKEDKDNNFIIKAPIWAIDKLVKSTMLHKDGSLVKMDIQVNVWVCAIFICVKANAAIQVFMMFFAVLFASQGAECHAINGMREVLEGVGVLKSELNPAMLEKQGECIFAVGL